MQIGAAGKEALLIGRAHSLFAADDAIAGPPWMLPCPFLTDRKTFPAHLL